MLDAIRRQVSHQLNELAREATSTAKRIGGGASAADVIAGRRVIAAAVPTTRQQRNTQDRYGLDIEWTRDGQRMKRKELLRDLAETLANG